MAYNDEIKQAYVQYIIEYIKTPEKWTEAFGLFPGTVTAYRNYFSLILDEDENQSKIKLIKKYFRLDEKKYFDDKETILNGSRTIKRFFDGKTKKPEIRTIEFIAQIFDLPIQSLHEFAAHNQPIQSTLNEKLEDDSRNTSQIQEAKTVFAKKLSFFKNILNKNKTKRTLKISIMGLISVFLLILYTSYQPGHDIDRLKQNVSFELPANIGNKLFSGKGEAQTADTLAYHTGSILNNESIHPDGRWKFDVDPEGEDLFSLKYGAEYAEIFRPRFHVSSGVIPIAHKKMEIEFNVENNSGRALYFSGVILQIVDSFPLNYRRITENRYESRRQNEVFEVELIPGSNLYAYRTDKRLIKSGESLFCTIAIKGKPQRKMIYKFNIIALLVNGNYQEKISLKSDKHYFIAL